MLSSVRQDMPHGVSDKSLTLADISKILEENKKKMASEQAITNEAITKAVAEATRVAIQALAAAATERPQSIEGPKICGTAMKQPSFNWEVDDKYGKLKNFRLEVNNIFALYNTPHTEQ